MANFLSATWLLFRSHLRDAIVSKRFVIAFLLCCGPPLIALVAAQEAGANEIVPALGTLMTLQVIAPIVGLLFGAAVITEEIENRTITYLFTRPLSRPALLLGRYLAAACVASALLAASASALVFASTQERSADATRRAEVVYETRPLVEDEAEPKPWRERRTFEGDGFWDGPTQTYFVFEQSGLTPGGEFELTSSTLDGGRRRDREPDGTVYERRLRMIRWLPLVRELPPGLASRFALAAALAGAIYSAISAALGVLFKRPMIIGLGYAFALEFILANVPGSSQSLSLQFYLRGLFYGTAEFPFRERFPPIVKTDFQTPMESGVHLAIVILVLLGSSIWLLRKRQFVLSS